MAAALVDERSGLLDKICGELRAVDRSGETSQVPTYVEGAFVAADYSEQP